jgi:1-deoxy-D-xylulose-5-phosphate reductoisomerase
MNKGRVRKVIILGSTGSLGVQALEVLEKYKKHFKVVGLSAYENKELLHRQAKKLDVPKGNIVLASKDGAGKIIDLAKLKDADIVINVLSGVAGIEPSRAALESGKTLLLGNKESLISGGMKFLKMAGKIIPIDSEHNAISEILKKFPKKKVEKIILPCSGGPLWSKTDRQLKKITVEDVLKHPKWNMGKKMLVESATLLNKGLEIIEAYYLFLLPLKKIEVVIHPECMIHGIVEFVGGEKIAYISKPDMKEHIENALLTASGMKASTRTIRKLKPKEYAFQNPNHKVLHGINIILKVFQQNPYKMENFLQKEEEVINKFLKGKIKFLDIFKLLDGKR